jgi:hypothetical protein
MTIRFSILLSSILVYSLLHIGCEDDPPPKPPGPPKPKRDFVWTIDTLEYPGSYQTLMYDIWVDSPTNAYVVGHNERGYGQMYHFDGIRWKDVNLFTSLPFALDLRSIQGFSTNNIYSVGRQLYTSITPPFIIYDSSLIIHYNGATWKKVELPHRKSALVDIFGSSPSNIWAGGNRGTLYHYNGIEWKNVALPDSFNVSSMTYSDSNSVYVSTYSFDPNMIITRYFMKVSETAWSVLDSYYELDPIRFGGVLQTFNNTLYSLFPYLYKYNSGVWSVEKTITGSSFTNMYALSNDNIFLIGIRDVVFHYNGEDWYEYPKFFKNLVNVDYNAVWANGSEIFIVGHTFGSPMNSVILHGK